MKPGFRVELLLAINGPDEVFLTNPDFSPGRLLLSGTFMLSISYGNLLTMPLLPTALDAPSLVFFPPVGTCFLNQSYDYAFGRRHSLAGKILRDHRITW